MFVRTLPVLIDCKNQSISSFLDYSSNLINSVMKYDLYPFRILANQYDLNSNILLNSKDATYFAAVTPQITTPATGIAQDNYKKVFDIQAGITKVRIYMWVEGQDVDCENNASGGSISYNLQFSTTTKTAKN